MSEFLVFIQDELSHILRSPIQVKRLFGGYGLFLRGQIFALIFNDELYLKINAYNQSLIHQQHWTQFSYLRQGKTIYLPYYQLPADMYDDLDILKSWIA